MRKKSTRKALKDIEKSITFVNKVITKEYADSGIIVETKINNYSIIGYPTVNIRLMIRHRNDLYQHVFSEIMTRDMIRAKADLLLEQLEEVQALEAFKARKARTQDTKPLPTLS